MIGYKQICFLNIPVILKLRQGAEPMSCLSKCINVDPGEISNPMLKMRTSKKKFRQALSAMEMWIISERCKLGTAMLMKKLRSKLQGHNNYYGVCGNIDMLRSFYWQTCKIVFKWLNRRSQRKSCNWKGFTEMLNYFRIPRPKIIGYWS